MLWLLQHHLLRDLQFALQRHGIPVVFAVSRSANRVAHHFGAFVL